MTEAAGSRTGWIFRLRAGLFNYLDELRESYWFLPTTLALGAIVLSLGTGWVDVNLALDLPDGFGFGLYIDSESARALLQTVAGAVIGVAGTAFSILIAAVVFASGQFGPRIVGNFMRDRRNQFALGVFLATFLYCLLVLRLVTPDQVPRLSLVTAFLLTLASVGTLIHFFHHASDSIRLSAIISKVGTSLLDHIKRRFPDDPEDHPAGDVEIPRAPADAVPVEAEATGYLRIVDFDGLVALAHYQGLCLRVDRKPGDFIVSRRAIAWVWPAAAAEDAVEDIRSAFEVGPSRTPAQDLRFLAQQLIDVAERGLSPGINDPRTAMSCLDWLAAALALAERGDIRPPVLCDEEGNPRVVLARESFADFAEFILGRLRPHFQTEYSAAMHMMEALGSLILEARTEEVREILLRHARELQEGVSECLVLQADIERVRQRYSDIEAIAGHRVPRLKAMERHPWL